ncbi:MAG TPA: nucleotidyl transferase AbiEii/AbiGii toxin family protein [Candidatus Paceibacterota bacterium]|nr:nucleotidyl transferase AbiEii/AbiGii toxin family protein [Candidatus Paceibacterota bacterium]
MYSKSLRDDTKKVLNKLAKLNFLNEFHLAGGTALALQLGHRESIDLDFFTFSKTIPGDIEKRISSLGKYFVEQKDNTTLDGELEGVKVSFFGHPYNQLYPFKKFKEVNIADERDIAAMKINAVVGRAFKKDFIDIYFLLKKYSLKELINFFKEKYSEVDYSTVLILKSLMYFYDLGGAMPKMKKSFDWEEAKKMIKKEAEQLLKDDFE